MTRATPIRSIAPDDIDSAPAWNALEEASAILRRGGLVAFPTETVYGLGADATDPVAVGRIFAAKGRPATNPLIVHADDLGLACRCVSAWPEAAAVLADRFWPGPLTLVLPRSKMIPDIVTAGLDSVGVRVPAVPVARALIRKVGRPLAAPSANRSTGISPTRAEHVRKDLDGRIDLILDTGPTSVGLESTVLDLTADPPRILRPGPIDASTLSIALGRPVLTPDSTAIRPPSNAIPEVPALSPGQMAIHYAPRTPALRVEPGALLPLDLLPPSDRLAVLTLGPGSQLDLPASRLRIDLPDPEIASRSLYDALHHCDEAGVSLILVVMPPDTPPWSALRDRLRRATRPGVRGGSIEK